MRKVVINLIFLSISLGFYNALSAQSVRKENSTKTVNIDVVLKPSPPAGPVAIPYPNMQIKYQPNGSQSSLISRGSTLVFELSGSNLENIASAEITPRNSGQNVFEVKLEAIRAGSKRIQRRTVIITAKNMDSQETLFKINFKKDSRSKAFYVREFRSKNK